MSWQLEWGDQVASLKKLWRETGIKPRALANQPKLNDSDIYYFKRFHELVKSRGSGEAFGPITQDQYTAHFLAYGPDGVNERARFQRMLSVLDEVYVEYMLKKRQAEIDRMNSSGSNPGARGGLLKR